MSKINEERILSETTPLIFQWLPVSFGKSIPNNEDYPYLQRLVNWAEKEPQRDIYLVINGTGLRLEQIKNLEENLKPLKNVKIVDFNKIDLNQDYFISLTSKRRIQISKFYKDLYCNNEQTDRMPFGLEIDLMRILILQNINEITGKDEAIYFDFDIFPDRDGRKIGEVASCSGILLNDLENSIIAIDIRGKKILLDALQTFLSKLPKETFNDIDNNMVWDAMKEEIKKYTDQDDDEYLKFHFSGNVQGESETSWMRSEELYKKHDLPITFDKSINTSVDRVKIINAQDQNIKL